MKTHLVLLLLLLTHFVFAGGPYRPPNMKKELFNPDKLQIDKISKAALFTGLICIARDFDEKKHQVAYDLRSNALAIAGRIGPDSESDTFKDVAADLKARGQTLMESGNSRAEISSKIYRSVRVLMRKKKNEDNMKCASYCIDIALRIDPGGPYATKFKEYQTITGKADWKDMFGAPVANNQKPPAPNPAAKVNNGFFKEPRNEFKARSQNIPGGNAAKFAATQRSLYGLAVRKLAIGRHAGVASSLSATARRTPGTKGINFHIAQKVGNNTGNSLDKIKQLMRVRHEQTGRSPSGYKVEIAFPKEDGPLIDGPSTGAAMALILDSLFTGRELDGKFAIAGEITADGKITPIGGIVGKIRGAAIKGCTLVGIPHANINGVSDLFVLDGIGKITSVQIFSFKTIDEAIAVASKDKPTHVQQAIDDFTEIAQIIKSKGAASLKDAQVIARLKNVVSKMPNHQSAKILLSIAKGEEKKILSRGASFHQINLRLSDLRPSLRKFMFTNSLSVSTTDRKNIRYATIEMDKVRPKIESRLKKYNNAVLSVFRILTTGRLKNEDGNKFHKRFKDAWNIAEVERQKLIADPAIIIELKG